MSRTPHRRLKRIVPLITLLALPLAFSNAVATAPTPEGRVAPEIRDAAEHGLFELPVRPHGLGTSAAFVSQTEWRVPIIMVSFLDDTMRYSAAGFDSTLFDTGHNMPGGSAYDYYQWVSGGRLSLSGRVVANVMLPHPRQYYGALSYGVAYSATPNNMYGALFDALTQCSRNVDWSEFDRDRDGYVDMVWLLHAGPAAEMSGDKNDFWSLTSRMSSTWRDGSAYLTNQPVAGGSGLFYRIDRFSTVPELSGIRPGRRSEIGVFCHEFGHALGLPDLYDTTLLGGGTGNVGPGNWSLMSTGTYGGNGSTPESPSHLGAWASILLGWTNVIRPTNDTTITLDPLSSGGSAVDVWYQGDSNPEHFLLECRAREGFDASINLGGLLISHADEAAIGQRMAANRINAGSPGLWLVEADGDSDLIVGRNRGDAYDPFPGLLGVHKIDEATKPSTVTFSGAPTNVSLSNIQRIGNQVRFDLQVRAPGWLPAADRSLGPFDPQPSSSSISALIDDDGNLHRVTSEVTGGLAQVVLRSRVQGVWLPPQTLTHSPAAALEPTLAKIGRSDLALAWSDTRGGRSRIYYRSRVRGAWSPDQLIGDQPGENSSPAIGVDAGGRVQIAWLNTLANQSSVWFTRFLYFAPWAQPVLVTSTTAAPGPPVIATARNGTSHLLWVDRATPVPRLYFARFQPDSGITPPLPLTGTPTYSQSNVTAIADSAGALHVAWVVNGGSAREIHYQRRAPNGPFTTRDSLIELRNAYVQDLALGADRTGTIHLVYDSAPEGTPQVFYKRWRPGRGWDVASTEITRPEDGSASQPVVLPTLPGRVSVLYIAYPELEARMMERERALEPAPIVLDAPSAATPVPAGLFLGPNPLRAGQPLQFRVGALGAGRTGTVDVFDVAGRRVATAALAGAGPELVGRLDAERTRGLHDGLYFARVRDRSGTEARFVVVR